MKHPEQAGPQTAEQGLSRAGVAEQWGVTAYNAEQGASEASKMFYN